MSGAVLVALGALLIFVAARGEALLALSDRLKRALSLLSVLPLTGCPPIVPDECGACHRDCGVLRDECHAVRDGLDACDENEAEAADGDDDGEEASR